MLYSFQKMLLSSSLTQVYSFTNNYLNQRILIDLLRVKRFKQFSITLDNQS